MDTGMLMQKNSVFKTLLASNNSQSICGKSSSNHFCLLNLMEVHLIGGKQFASKTTIKECKKC
jgi:hypothetical protein